MIDKVYKAYDIRGIYPEPLNEEIAWKTGNATAQFLRMNLTGLAKADPRMNMIIVGRDMRTSSPSLAKAFIDGILQHRHERDRHRDDRYAGNLFRDQSFGLLRWDSGDGFAQSGELQRIQDQRDRGAADWRRIPGLNEIKRLATKIRKGPSAQTGRVETMDLSRPYKTHVLQFLKLQRPLKVVVDCSNGMAGKFVPSIFGWGQPNLEIVPINLEITGTFKHEPNPLVDANLRELQEAVVSHAADFGVCFDGDADRCIFVDEQAKIVRCDILTAFLAKDFLKNNPGSAIVYDLRSSRVVREEILNAGGIPKRERVGHVFMKKALADSRGVFRRRAVGALLFPGFVQNGFRGHCVCGDFFRAVRL